VGGFSKACPECSRRLDKNQAIIFIRGWQLPIYHFTLDQVFFKNSLKLLPYIAIKNSSVNCSSESIERISFAFQFPGLFSISLVMKMIFLSVDSLLSSSYIFVYPST
jgi:hypothetical protein